MTGMCCLEVSAIHANSDVTTYMIITYSTPQYKHIRFSIYSVVL